MTDTMTLDLAQRVRLAFANSLKDARQLEEQELDYERIVSRMVQKAADLIQPLVTGVSEGGTLIRLAVLKTSTPTPKKAGSQKSGAIEIGVFYPDVIEPVVQFSFTYHATPMWANLTLVRMSDVNLEAWLQAELDMTQLPAWVYDIPSASYQPKNPTAERFYTRVLYRAAQIIATDIAKREAAITRQQERP